MSDAEALGSSRDWIVDASSPKAVEKKPLKVLIISENSADIYLIKKFLAREEGYIVHEAPTLSKALKVMHYLNLDLIVVDDMLSDIDGYEVVQKLNYIDIAKYIPKIILLTTDYKSEKKESFHAENLDFVKKPLDKVIFKMRVKSLIKNAGYQRREKHYFKSLALEKFQESQSLMAIYQEVFDSSETMMCIFERENQKIVEANALFENFFLNVNALNRILSNPRLIRKFVPFRDEANYLNYYHPKEWMQTVLESDSFNYSVTLQRDFKEYSFTISIRDIFHGQRGEYYLIKLSNIYDYLPQKKSNTNSHKFDLKEKNLEVFKDDFLTLRKLLWQQMDHDEMIESLLYKLSTKLSIICEDATIVQERGKQIEINLYFTIVKLLKNKFLVHNISINGQKVDSQLGENCELFFAPIEEEAVANLLFTLLHDYYGGDFNSTSKEVDLDILLYEKENAMMIELHFESQEDVVNEREKSVYLKEEIIDALPKSMKESLLTLHADIQKSEENRKSTYLITLPV